ncbi:hypothetical protein VTI74DRAFT_3973 [Chaetomium olivicolor]
MVNCEGPIPSLNNNGPSAGTEPGTVDKRKTRDQRRALSPAVRDCCLAGPIRWRHLRRGEHRGAAQDRQMQVCCSPQPLAERRRVTYRERRGKKLPCFSRRLPLVSVSFVHPPLCISPFRSRVSKQIKGLHACRRGPWPAPPVGLTRLGPPACPRIWLRKKSRQGSAILQLFRLLRVTHPMPRRALSAPRGGSLRCLEPKRRRSRGHVAQQPSRASGQETHLSPTRSGDDLLTNGTSQMWEPRANG